ncbi:MAG TPA: hypothetical protein VFV49_05040, partial [Thermoanaerobaculia bacterium]|nr:hypothetical protein [Thermoanaerobaculia bacterium]
TATTFNVSGGSGTITWGPSISQANGARVVSVAGGNSSVINFNGNVSSTVAGTGVILTASSGTYNFNATNTFSGTGSGILISNGQSGTITFSNSTTNTVTGTAFQVDGSVAVVTAAITYSGTIAKITGGFMIDVNNLDAPGTLTMTHTPAAAGNLSISSNGSTGISVVNSSSTNITIANASVTFQNAGPGFTSTTNTGGTINLQGIALAGSGNDQGMLLAGAGTINVTNGVAASSINMTGASVNAIDGTTTAFTGTLNINNTAITGGGATAVRLGGGTLSGTGSTIAAGAQTALNLSGVALTNGAGISATSTGGANGVILANVTGGTYTIGGSLTGNTAAAWVHTNSAVNAATITFTGPITPAINARAIDIGSGVASTGLRGGTVTFSGNITTTSNAVSANAGGIRVRNSTAGALTLTGTTISISSNVNIGVELTTNPGATFNFNGGTQTFASTTGKAFTATGGGTVNVTGANNTITTTGANGLEVIGTSLVHFAGTITFKSITAAGGSKGVSLQFFDGPFTIAGDGTASLTAGGTISTMTTRGIELISVTGAVSIQNMTFTNAATTQTVTGGVCGLNLNTGNPTGCNAPMYLESTSAGVTLNRLSINGSVQGGIVGYIVTNLVMSNIEVQNCGNEVGENGILMKNLLGTGTATALNIHNNSAKQFHIINTTNNDLTSFAITSSTFANTVAPNGGQGVLVESFDSGTSVNVSVGTSQFSSLFTNAHQTAANSGSTQTIALTGSTITNANAWTLIQASDGSTVNFNVTGNNGSTGALSDSNAINIKTDNADLAGPASNATGTINGNTIGTAAVGSGAECGGGCSGIQVAQQHGGTVTVDIFGNNIRHVDAHGIRFLSGNGNGKLIANVSGNLIQDPDNSPVQTLAAIIVAGGTVGADTVCAQATIGGTINPGAWPVTATNNMNRILGNWDPTPGSVGNEIFLWETGSSTIAVPGASLPISTFVAGRNSIASADGTSVSTSGNVVAGTCP